MKRRVLILLIALSASIAAGPMFTGVIDPGLRVLHLDLDPASIDRVQQLGLELGWRLTSWNPLCSRRSAARFLGSLEDPGVIYMMTRERAEGIWATNWPYFAHFDVVITSALLARIFLQLKKWDGLLIILIPKDFDYYSDRGLRADYYTLFQCAIGTPNVQTVDISQGW